MSTSIQSKHRKLDVDANPATMGHGVKKNDRRETARTGKSAADKITKVDVKAAILGKLGSVPGGWNIVANPEAAESVTEPSPGILVVGSAHPKANVFEFRAISKCQIDFDPNERCPLYRVVDGRVTVKGSTLKVILYPPEPW